MKTNTVEAEKECWVFTFGYGQKHEGKFVKIYGRDFGDARQVMFDRYGREWAFQYSEEEWSDWEKRRPWYMKETLLEEIW